MGRMIFDLTDEDRDTLEALRIKMGLRSHAETLRALIRGPGGEPVPAAGPSPKPSFSHGRSKTVVAGAKRERVDVVAPPRARLDLPVGPRKVEYGALAKKPKR